MNKQLSPYGRRILIALAFSMLIHALVIWLPQIKLSHLNETLPEMVIKLEPLPIKKKEVLATKSRKKIPSKKTADTPKRSLADFAPIAASSISKAETLAESAVSAIDPASAPQIALSVAEQVEPAAASETDKIPFPRHARLLFAVRNGDDGFRVGELMHNLDIDENRYIIQSSTRTTGIARWFKSFDLNQTSTGTVSSSGLLPDNFSEEKLNSGQLETATVIFDRNANSLLFSNGENVQLPESTQDALSILYQLSLSNLNKETIPVTISTGKKMEQYVLEIATNKTITTDLGELNTVQLRKIREAGKPGLRIWLSKEHRLLPVKIQYLEPDNTISATLSIIDIRFSDN